MPFTKFTDLDFDQIKESIKSYLRANSDFSGFDFEGSNFSVLLDTLAYNTYITAFNSNMVVNESFLDSATLRENVVSLARNIGYVPKSRTAAKASVSLSIDVEGTESPTFVLKKGLVCVGSLNDTSYTFSILEDIQKSTTITDFNFDGTPVNNRTATFENVEILQGTFLTKQFVVDSSLDQRFVIDNSFVDTSTIRVYVKKEGDSGLGLQYQLINNITNVTGSSYIFLIQEIQDEKYELLFGDGLIGRKLETGDIITVDYLVTDGKEGNDASRFSFAGAVVDSNGNAVVPKPFTVTTSQKAQNGGEIESVDSIKYFAPRIYSAQNRAVTGRDYESIIKTIYPDTESVSVVGGEELDPPEFGTVQISIKPKNGFLVSDFNKSRILSQLKQYSISGINQKILDLKLLYIELDSFVYYNDSMTTTPEDLKTKISNSLTTYSKSTDLNKFGGRFRYSKVLRTIDSTDTSITSNITRVKIRRNLFALLNQFAQYELCFGNQFHVSEEGKNIKSTGFRVSGETDIVYLTDVPNPDKKTGIVSIVKNLPDGTVRVVAKSAGTIDYVKGEINLGTVNIVSTAKPNNVIEIQAFPESNDVIGLRDLYLNFDLSETKINMIKDVISSGDEISGTVFSRDFYTSSYSNGSLIRE
jgi:acylphosphatase